MTKMRMSLRVTHPSMNSAFIANQLALKPKTSWTAGEQRLSPRGTPLGIAEASYCNFELKVAGDVGLAEALATHVERIAKHATFLSELVATGGRVEFYVGWFIEKHAGELLDDELLRHLADLRINLAIEVYGPDAKAFEPVVLDFNKKSS